MNAKSKITIVAAASLLALSAISNIHAGSIRDEFIRSQKVIKSLQATKVESHPVFDGAWLCPTATTECQQTCCEEYRPGSLLSSINYSSCLSICLAEELVGTRSKYDEDETTQDAVRDSLRRARQVLKEIQEQLDCRTKCSDSCEITCLEQECLDACTDYSWDSDEEEPWGICSETRNCQV